MIVGVTASNDSANKGMLVVFNDHIYDAWNVSKIDAKNNDAFNSPSGGVIGDAYSADIKYYYIPSRLNASKSVFDIKDLNQIWKC